MIGSLETIFWDNTTMWPWPKKIVFVCLSFHLGTCWVGPPIDNFFPSSSHLFRLREATFWNVLFPDETGTVENFLRPIFFPVLFT